MVCNNFLLLHTRKSSNIFNYYIFICFIFFSQSKKISYIFNYAIFYIFIFFKPWTFHPYILWKKIVLFYKNESLLYSLKKRLKILSLQKLRWFLSNIKILWIMQIMINLKFKSVWNSCGIFIKFFKNFFIKLFPNI